MAKKKKKKSRKKSARFMPSHIIIPIALVGAILATLGYIGKRSIEKTIPEIEEIQLDDAKEKEADIIIEEPTKAPDTATKPQKDEKTGDKATAKPQQKATAKPQQNTDKKATPRPNDNKKQENKQNNISYATDASVKKLLRNALAPMGTTMYVYGGGWDNADKGASKSTTTIGLSRDWEIFYSKQDSMYNHKNYSDRTKGLDSSGYIGWVLYNTLHNKDGQSGFVYKADEFDEKLSRE